MMEKNQRTNDEYFGFLVVAVIYSAILFFAAFRFHISPEEQTPAVILFTFLFLSIVFLFLHRTKMVGAIFSWFLSSRTAHLFSVVLFFGCVICLTFSFAGGVGRYARIGPSLFPIFFLVLFFTFETFVFQVIHTKEQIGGSFWKIISSISFSKEDKLIFLAIVLAAGFVIAVMVNYYRGYYQLQPYPYNTFLFEIDDKFEDFFVVVGETIGMNPYENFLSGQYPFTLLVGSLFSAFTNNTAYLLFVAIFAIVFYVLSFHFLRLEKTSLGILMTLIITTLSYPLLFSIDRGNFEMLVFAFLLIFLFYYNQSKYVEAAIFLGLAAALKIYPAIFLLLFIKDRKFKEAALSVGTMLGLTLVSLLFFEGGIWKNLQYLVNFSNISNNWVFNSFLSIEKGTLVQRGVSLLTFIKIVVHQLNIPLSVFVTSNFLFIYFVLVAVLFLPIAYYVVFIEKSLWKNVALLTISMLLLPTLSADYKLMHMYLPLFLFVNSKETSRLDIFYLISFAILLIPKNYFFLQNVVSDASKSHDISLAVTTNISVLLMLVVTIMTPGIIARIKFIIKDKRLKPAIHGR